MVGRFHQSLLHAAGRVGRVERVAVAVPFEDHGRVRDGHVPGVYFGAAVGVSVDWFGFAQGDLAGGFLAYAREESGTFDRLNGDGRVKLSRSLKISPVKRLAGGGAAKAGTNTRLPKQIRERYSIVPQ